MEGPICSASLFLKAPHSIKIKLVLYSVTYLNWMDNVLFMDKEEPQYNQY